MSDFLTRNRLVLAKVEVTSGTDSSPVPGTDAVLVEEPKANPNFELEQTNEVSGTLDTTQSIVGGGYMERTHRFFAKGSGTPGTAPEFAPYLQAAGLGLTTLASAVTGTARAGTTNTIQLASGGPSTDLTGFVIVTTGGTGPDQTRVITAYDTTSKTATTYPDWDVTPDNTTTYSVKAGNLFVPSSSALKTITDYLYKKNAGSGNAILEAITGAAANLSFAMQTRQTGKFTATLRGIMQAPQDVANPTGAVFDSVRPRPLRDADAWLDGRQVCFRDFTFDLGNKIVQGDCPGAEFGYDPARVTSRKIAGRLNPQLLVLSDRDAFADLTAGAVKPLWLNWGEVDGNRVSIFMPAIAYTGQEDEDLDGISGEGLPFEATAVDSGLYLLFW